jgi:hypothetical protein
MMKMVRRRRRPPAGGPAAVLCLSLALFCADAAGRPLAPPRVAPSRARITALLPAPPPVKVPVVTAPPPVKVPVVTAPPPVKVPVVPAPPPVKVPIPAPPVKVPIPAPPPVRVPAPAPPPVKVPASAPPPHLKMPTVPTPTASSPSVPRVPTPAEATNSGGRGKATPLLSPRPGSPSPAGPTISTGRGPRPTPSGILGSAAGGGPAVNSPADVLSAAAGQFSLAGGLSGGLGALQEATARARGTSVARQAGIWQHALRVAVRGLQACLGNLPSNLRRVVERATGIDVPHDLSPAAVAASLHVTARQLAHLEKLGLQRLLGAARTHACGSGTQPSSGLLAVGTFGPFIGEPGAPAGGVLAARYAKLPSPAPAAPRSTAGRGLLGISAPVAAAGVLLTIVLALGGVLGAGLLTGLAPWWPRDNGRVRWIHRHPWSWHG